MPTARTTRHASRTVCPSRVGHSAASVRGGTRTGGKHSAGCSAATGAVVLLADGTPDGLGEGAGGESSGPAAEADGNPADGSRSSQHPQ